jgi:DNA polymerase III delta prime subunit
MSKTKLIKDFSYPEPSDPDIQFKLFKKREFYYHQIKPREKMQSYDDIKNYRDQVCSGDFKLREQQAIMSNLFNPNTPYKGLLVMHGTGTGKSCTAISIAEQFKDQVKKYNTKIYILTFGPNGRESIKTEILTCTGDTYVKNKEIQSQMVSAEIEREAKVAINAALQIYKILSYKTFYKKVLGEKITEKDNLKDNKTKLKYRRNEEGELERELVVERITNMDNTILIVDEAHNLTGNEYGEALKKIIKESENLRVILLTATPMKNLADDIVDLLNFIRPLNDQLIREKIFTSETNFNMKIKPGGIEYLKQKASGYVSFFRGNIPFTFAKKIDKGVIPNGLLFTPVVKCFMEKFQFNTYLEATKNIKDKLDRASSSAANFVFPGLNKEKNDIMGFYSNDGINIIQSQINTDGDKLRSLINKKLFNNKLNKEVEENFILINEKKNISGYILKKEYLRFFSIKFYKALNRINKLFIDTSDKKLGTMFIYSNLVKAGGMEIFAEVLLMNGYLEYQEDKKNYNIKEDTIDYKTGLKFSDYKKIYKISDFAPAVYILITGSTDEGMEDIPEVKQKIIRNVFNNVNNIDGKYIKLLLGSKVMNEGITLENVKEIHILDVHYNLGKVQQVIGRGIRMCKHIKSINDENRFPKVNVYRYVVSINETDHKLTKLQKKMSKLSTDEILYQKAELKYLVVKDIEHALKEVAVDCPLLLNGNIFPEEIEKYKGCYYPTLENVKAGKKICPALCDFKECDLKCDSKKLNDSYLDKNTYKLNLKELDYNTFNDELAKTEIMSIKNKIKDIYRFKHVYLYEEILTEIKNSFEKYQIELFEDYFLDQAIEDLMPKNENDKNNFKDVIYDKYNRPGYIIQRDKYFIFQPFDENEEVTMFYRKHVDINQQNKVSIKNYVKQNFGNVKIKEIKDDNLQKIVIGYNFDDVMEYYNNRDENKTVVGVIDKNFNKLASSDNDLFKIRPPQSKLVQKKRGTNISTFFGSVCSTTKDRIFLLELIKKIPNISNDEIKKIEKETRLNICELLKIKLLYLEKYSTIKDNNKFTYVIIPSDHKIYPFPYNLEDRVKYRINTINKLLGKNIEINIIEKEKKENKEKYYILTFKNNENFNKFKLELEKLNCKLENNDWSLILE